MSHVTLFSASFCGGEEVARETAGRLGCELLGRELLERASERFGAPVEKLARAMEGPLPFSLEPSRERARLLSYVRATLAAELARDGLVVHGFAGHLVPGAITHVLRVCLVATPEFRLSRAVESLGVSRARARRRLDRDDLSRGRWTRFLFRCGPWDRHLYDLRIPMHRRTVAEAADRIAGSLARPALRPTPASRRAAADFELASRVRLALTERGHTEDVSCEAGRVTILVNRPVLRLERHRERLARIARSVEGVGPVEVRPGPDFYETSFYREEEFQVPTRVLLVDDERDFVETLSERLRIRDIDSAVAFRGEEALDLVREGGLEVMVLDLRMPGMDGIEVLRRVKHDHPHVEVIILTGHGTERDRALAEELGAFAYLQKPVDFEVLSRTMQRAAEKSRRARSAAREREAEDPG